MGRNTLIIIGAALFCSGLAGPTGLITIPIADILRHREMSFTHAIVGTEPRFDKRYIHAGGIQAGVFDRAEFGFDTDYEGDFTFNAKALLYETPESGRFALSAGVQTFQDGKGDPYVVARMDFASFRLHGGWLRDTRHRMIVGVDFPICGDYVGIAEHTTGRDGSTWFGVAGPLFGVPGLSFSVGIGMPHAKADPIQHTATISYGLRF